MSRMLKQTFGKNEYSQLEIIVNDAANCTTCTHEDLCSYHTETIKTILINEAQHRIDELNLIS